MTRLTIDKSKTEDSTESRDAEVRMTEKEFEGALFFPEKSSLSVCDFDVLLEIILLYSLILLTLRINLKLFQQNSIKNIPTLLCCNRIKPQV